MDTKSGLIKQITLIQESAILAAYWFKKKDEKFFQYLSDLFSRVKVLEQETDKTFHYPKKEDVDPTKLTEIIADIINTTLKIEAAIKIMQREDITNNYIAVLVTLTESLRIIFRENKA